MVENFIINCYKFGGLMPKLEKIRINTFNNRHELRIDWDNDRHQGISLKSLTPKDVKQGLLDAVHLIAIEQQNEHL
jgi:hypothetical protein